MRLLFIAAHNLRTNDGISHYVRHVARLLAERCEVTVLTPTPEAAIPGCRMVGIWEKASSRSGRLLWYNARSPSYAAHYDVLFSPVPVAPPRSRAPTISVVHDLTPLVTPHLVPPHTALLCRAELRTLHRATRVLVDSENSLRDLLRLSRIPRETIQVLYPGPGVQPAARTSGLVDRLSPYVLCVGGYGQNKNARRLLEAFARLEAGTRPNLVIAGWGEPRQVIAARRAAERLGIAERVVLLSDRQSDAQLSELYAGCLAFVYPSLYEGFGMPILEAMAHGAPVACSNTSSMPEVGGDAAVYFHPESVEQIAASLRMLLTEPKTANRLRSIGPLRAQGFSWDETTRRLHELAVSLLQASRAAGKDE